MKETDCNVFPDKIMMEKILEWFKKIEKEKIIYEFKHTNKPIKRRVK